nr:hypothetical protein [Tanacetum cinerariifolium]
MYGSRGALTTLVPTLDGSEEFWKSGEYAPGLLVCWGMMVEGSGDSVKWWGVAGIGGSRFVESGGKVRRMNRTHKQHGLSISKLIKTIISRLQDPSKKRVSDL